MECDNGSNATCSGMSDIIEATTDDDMFELDFAEDTILAVGLGIGDDNECGSPIFRAMISHNTTQLNLQD